MVGITIGLIVVAGATLLTATQLSENRRLLLETQVQQDLRAATDIITRELRRGGYQFAPPSLIWSPEDPTTQPVPNNYRGLVLNTGGEVVSYRYFRPGTPSVSNTYVFSYSLVNGTSRQRFDGGAPQDLTDRTSMLITDFTVQLQPVVTRQLACPQLCADGTQNCWPTIKLTDAVVTITGQPANDTTGTLSRTMRSRVRMRNEGVDFLVSPTQVCP